MYGVKPRIHSHITNRQVGHCKKSLCVVQAHRGQKQMEISLRTIFFLQDLVYGFSGEKQLFGTGFTGDTCSATEAAEILWKLCAAA